MAVACSEAAQGGSTSGGTAGEPSTSSEGKQVLLRLGAECVPPSEHQSTYVGADIGEASVEAMDECASGMCLVNHFQGRVTCPYGQNQEQIDTLPPDHPERCRLPSLSGASEDEAVSVAVPPWLMGRPPSDAVYCSCRCDGPDPDADYCSCPEELECVELFEDTGSEASRAIAGSYCVKSGTVYDPDASYGAPCSESVPDAGAVCGPSNP